ncbi:cytochrome P450 [Sciscionella marina]|uniref:cytochrome P450 n=1 Tax=Sciscionella marina TaxID=508770 RepID=UPI00036DC901|nr:cytochrome P450 [Sciscionella marina]
MITSSSDDETTAPPGTPGVLPTGWADDFDLHNPVYLADPYSVWARMRTECPVARTERDGGGYLPVRHADVTAVALNPQTFSSRAGEVTGPIPEAGRELRLPPVTSDPPEHAADRRLLVPLFTKPAIARYEAATKGTATALIDDFGDRTEVDAANEYARDIPVAVISDMLGLPFEDRGQFHDWTVRMLKDGADDYEIRADAVHAIQDYFSELVRARAVKADSGVLSFLLHRQADDPGLTDERVVGMSFLMLIAGIDTTWSALGAILWHLATHEGDRRTLAADRTQIPSAIEEFLRMYAPVTIGRVVTEEATVGGRAVCPGERVILPWAAANHDPEVFDRPDEFVLGRERNRHLAFGAGIHRCLGAHLAQMELRVALGEWLRRIPEFTLSPGTEIAWTAGNTRGPKTLPIRIG